MTRFKCYDCGCSWLANIVRGPTVDHVGFCMVCGKGHLHVTAEVEPTEESPWRRYPEELPSFDLPVLVKWERKEHSVSAGYDVAHLSHRRGAPEWFYMTDILMDGVTHWMPIPQLPKPPKNAEELLREIHQAILEGHGPYNQFQIKFDPKWEKEVNRLIGYVRKASVPVEEPPAFGERICAFCGRRCVSYGDNLCPECSDNTKIK
jgi:hypothetical protein